MTTFYRSTIAVLISLSLAACGSSDNKETPEPEPEIPVVEPLPTEQIDVQIGANTIQALKESVVINNLAGEPTRVELEAFKGIPYATAARFEHSTLADIGEITDATEFGDACPQLGVTKQAQSEECLNLNIWRPENTVESADLPVYVFIHGGDFEFGSGSDPVVQADNVVAQGANDGQPFIAVSLNYRLGILGSYWLDGASSKNPQGGNFGLGDQKRALEWVHNNISAFGGNPEKVTLVGQGAGAMSVGILQQTETEEVISGTYFQRAIMQSNPYGFDYKSYNQAKTYQGKLQAYGDELFGSTAAVSLNDLTLEQIMQVQEKALNPLAKIGAWSGLDCIDLDNLVGSGLCFTSKLSAEITPFANMKPFAPYMDYRPRGGIFEPEVKGYHLQAQPALTALNVPTVLGFNTNDSRTVSFVPSLTSLIPTIIELIEQQNNAPEDPDAAAADIEAWLASQDNLALLEQQLMGLTADEIEAQLELGDILPSTAYEPITRFFFGLGNGELIDKVFDLTDFYPNAENELTGATGNMAQFNLLTNDMLFSGPAHVKAKQTSDTAAQSVTLYNFDYQPSFNVWTTSNDSTSFELGTLIRSISCIGKMCVGAELPFVFNKPYTVTGNKVTPSESDAALMDKLSRLWFSDALFDNYQFTTADDSVLVIGADASIQAEADWDRRKQAGLDPELRDGRLSGLESLGLIFGYFD